ncbi:uncharacterized protein LOC120670784 isoform X2 [Panicum virgatum]|uniref:uncharacterized protein LOC120670784 isoform X2 n=1 Tax=Panicum virgatum TaxID=38727 RepID=UPI0019D5C4ED|nr:uncharacterized protein LOC120670784 isoform X2 [Panicum virgatum]
MYSPRAQRMTDFQSMKNLSKAIDFAKRNLLAGNKIILVCCQNGEDIIICVSLAIVTLLFDDNGCFDCVHSFMKRDIARLEMTKRLVYIHLQICSKCTAI